MGALHDVSWKVDIDMGSPIQSVPRGEGRFPCYVALQFCSPHVAMIFSKSRVMEQLRESEPQGRNECPHNRARGSADGPLSTVVAWGIGWRALPAHWARGSPTLFEVCHQSGGLRFHFIPCKANKHAKHVCLFVDTHCNITTRPNMFLNIFPRNCGDGW